MSKLYHWKWAGENSFPLFPAAKDVPQKEWSCNGYRNVYPHRAMPVCTNHPLIFHFYIHRTWRGCIRGVDWSQIKAALSCLHLYGLTAVSGLSIFNNKDGRQVNCCFLSYSCVSQQTKKLNYCLSQDDFSWRSPSAWWVVERKIAHFLQSISFYTVFNKGKLAFNNNLH